MAKVQSQRLIAFKAFLFSRRSIAVAKGTLAYCIALTLACLSDFDGLFKEPQAMTSMMLIIIAGQPGKSIGFTVMSITSALLGVFLGCLNFLILAKLSHATVGQAFYYFFVVYVLAYLKATKPALFGFSLLGILMSFNGVYNGYLVGRRFDHLYMLSYLYAYLWGAAIVLFVNIFVFPVTAEKELRELMVESLEHVEAFGLLIYKSYTTKLSPEDKAIRDSLAQTIRADFGRMSGKLAESSLEINWSRWSIDDYRYFIGKTRAIQQARMKALISTHSTISRLENDSDQIFKTTFMPKSLKACNRVVIDLRMGIQEIMEQFGAPHSNISGCLWESYMDAEREALNIERPSFEGRPTSLEDGAQAGELKDISRRLAAEFEDVDNTDSDGSDVRRTSFGNRVNITKDPRTGTMSTTTAVGSPTEDEKKLAAEAEKKSGKPIQESTPEILKERGMAALESDFVEYQSLQYDLLNKALTSGALMGIADKTQLRVHTRQPSIYEAYGIDYVRGAGDSDHNPLDLSPLLLPPFAPVDGVPKKRKAGSLMHKHSRQKLAGQMASEMAGDDSESDEYGPETIEEIENHSLVMVHSMLFSLGQYVKELSAFHARATKPKPKGLHFHLFESVAHKDDPAEKDDTELSLAEAMAMLESRPYVRKQYTWGERIHQIRAKVTDQTSLFALKAAAAATVYAMFIYAAKTRSWFVSYALSSGLLTIVLALAPTLGQSAVTFILQIGGSSIGYLLGLAVLSIFNNVGGYKYNPYGVVSLMTLLCIPLQYIMACRSRSSTSTCMSSHIGLGSCSLQYEHPKYFAFSFLSLNGAGVLIISEWIYRVHDHDYLFDSPAFRTGKALTATAMAVLVCAIFQLFVLRNPARRTLRNALAKVTYANLAYLTMLSAFVRAAVPADPSHQVPEQAVARVHKELKKREMQIQGDIIAMMPLIFFSSAEPSLSKPFNPKLILRAIRVNQVILDRLREGRAAIGTTRIDDVILKNFVTVLSPYRRRSARAAKNILGMCAATLNAKTPLPEDMPFLGRHKALADLVHDGLLLSYRFANTEEGRRAARTDDFTRYWFYVVSLNSIFPQLDDFEVILEEMFGRLEDRLA
ncbi:hypothetical protein FRB98_006792 [Tulasnella sp. 332]|nr:hypothetical protein FRB98_006792 [Tulasnella sp. 332]